MPSAIFVTTLSGGTPVLPEITEDEQPIPDGTGFSTIGYSPQDTIIVKVTRQQSVLDAMKLDETYLWVEDCIDAEPAIG